MTRRKLLTPEEKMELFVQKASSMDDRQLAINILAIIHYRVEDRSNQLSGLIGSLTSFIENLGPDISEFDKLLTVITPKIVQLVECQIDNDNNLVKIFEALNKNGQVSISRRQKDQAEVESEVSTDDTTTLKDHTSIFNFGDDEDDTPSNPFEDWDEEELPPYKQTEDDE